MSVQGRTLDSQTQQLVVNLMNYFEREKKNGAPLKPLSGVQERVADGLGISISTARRIKSRSMKLPVLSSPGKKRPRRNLKSVDIPDASKMNVTIKTLNAELQENTTSLSNSSLNRVLHDIGFKFKTESNRNFGA